MKLKALLLLFAAAMVFAVPARAQTYQILFAFTGFDYQDPNTVPGPNPDPGYLAVGEGYNIVSFVTSFGPLLSPYVDPSLYEYTHFLTGMTVKAHSYFAGFLEADFNDGGRSRYYRDPKLGGTAADYGVNPPNATSPSTFTDGSLRLGGRVDGGILTYNFNTSSGNLSATMTLDEGPDLVYIPPGSETGWTLAGTFGPPNPIPTGYDNQVVGECEVLVTPVTHKTWGAVKALYR